MYNCKLPAHFKNQTMHKHPFRKITVLAGICCILLSACKKAEYYQLSQEEQDEWSTYGANQSFNFISTQGNLIPYKSGGLYRAYHQSGDLYEEYLYTAINRTDTSIESNVGGVFIDKKASGIEVKVGLPNFYKNVKINGLQQTIQSINGKNYPDVYILVADPLQTDSIHNIDSIFYSKAYGFLKYTDIYGETYTITQ
ncbi:MAG: hypothetical protein JNK61_06155 [Bacteroidia bacterium]|nr:hypothetical protein [Bacteroidia bacterium]